MNVRKPAKGKVKEEETTNASELVNTVKQEGHGHLRTSEKEFCAVTRKSSLAIERQYLESPSFSPLNLHFVFVSCSERSGGTGVDAHGKSRISWFSTSYDGRLIVFWGISMF